jgi:hypothetical protein
VIFTNKQLVNKYLVAFIFLMLLVSVINYSDNWITCTIRAFMQCVLGHLCLFQKKLLKNCRCQSHLCFLCFLFSLAFALKWTCKYPYLWVSVLLYWLHSGKLAEPLFSARIVGESGEIAFLWVFVEYHGVNEWIS